MKATTTLNLALVAAMFCMAYNLRCANVVLLTASSTGAMRATAWTMSWMTISHQVGAFLSALSLWPLSMIFGRKPLLMTAVVAAIISGILGAASTSVYYLFVSYGLSGISSGVTYIIASLWIVENSPVKIRGQRLILINIGVCLGSAVGEWINFGVAMSSASYRIPFGLQFVFQIPTLVLIYLAPESYRWLLNHGQADRANFVLNALEQNLKTADGGSYLQELQQHQSSCTNSPGILSCFSRRLRSGQSEAGPLMGLLNVHPRRRFLLIIGAQLIPGLCGLMTASYYLGRAINGIQYSPTTGTAVLTSFLPTFDIIFQIPPYLLISRFGIRKLYMVSLAGMALCFAIITPMAFGQSHSYSSMWSSRASSTDDDNLQAYSAALLCFNLMLYVFYNLGVSPLPWLLQAELTTSLTAPNRWDLSTALPALAAALRHAVETGMLFASSSGVGVGPAFLIVWIFACLIFAGVVWAFYPETQGRKLEELDRYFAGAPRVLVGLDRSARRVQTVGGETRAEEQEMSRTVSPRVRVERFKGDDDRQF